MKQDEARKTKHHHTPSNQGKANGPSHEATRYPEGGTSTETGPGRRKGPTEGGGKQQPAGEGATHSPTKNKDKEASQHRRWHTKAKEKTTAKSQAEAPTIQNTTQRSHSTRGTEEKTKDKPRARKARPKTSKIRGPGGGQDHKNASKKTPTTQQQVGASH